VVDDDRSKFLTIGRTPQDEFGANPDTLDRLAVRYLLVDNRYKKFDAGVAAQYPLVFDDARAGVRVYENTNAWPRAYVSPALTTRADAGAMRPTRQVAIAENRQLDDAAEAAGVPSSAEAEPDDMTATIVEDDNDRVVVEVSASQPGVLVLTDSYHANWKATVDGAAAPVGRVNDAFRAVVVPAGDSTVVFRYESTPRRVGAWISITTIVLLVVGTLVSAVRARRPSPAERGR
jgi:hypothetical protein